MQRPSAPIRGQFIWWQQVFWQPSQLFGAPPAACQLGFMVICAAFENMGGSVSFWGYRSR